MESALAPNGFAFVLNTSLPYRSPQRFPYISMIFSDLKHMCPKAKALAAKYSTLLQGPSYLWNGYYQIYKCVDRLPDQAGINKVLTERPQDEVRTQAANSTEIGLHSHQEITPGVFLQSIWFLKSFHTPSIFHHQLITWNTC